MNYSCDHQDSFGNFCNSPAEIIIEGGVANPTQDEFYSCERCYELHYTDLRAKYINGLSEQKKIQKEEG